jgi:hypothetical protein
MKGKMAKWLTKLLTMGLQEPEMVKLIVWMIQPRKLGNSRTGDPEENEWGALTSLEAVVSNGEKISQQAFLSEQKHEKTNRRYSAWLAETPYQQGPRGVI